MTANPIAATARGASTQRRDVTHGPSPSLYKVIAATECFLLLTLIAAPAALTLVAFAVFVVHRHRVGTRQALLLTLVQVAATANYRTVRSHPAFQIAGLSFSTVDILSLLSLALVLGDLAFVLARSDRYPRRLAGRLVALSAYGSVPLLITWSESPHDFPIAVRNMRSLLYVLMAITFVVTVKKIPGFAATLLVTFNLAAAGAAFTQLAQALGLVSLAGFADAALVLEWDSLVRLGIVEEAFFPVFVACAVASVVMFAGPIKQSGLIAIAMLAAALVGSPGRGAIFASSAGIIAACLMAGRRTAAGAGFRASLRLPLVLSVASAGLAFALVTVAKTDESRQVFAERAREGLAPWSEKDVAGRVNSWRAGFDFGEEGPLFGRGLGTRFEQFKVEKNLDSDYDFAGTPPNLFAKLGLVGLVLMFLLLVEPIRAGARAWRARAVVPALIVGPMSVALFARSLSDELTLSFQFPVIFSVMACLAATASAESPTRGAARRVHLQ